MRSRWDLLPRWTCDMIDAERGTVCNHEAKWRRRFLETAASWTCYCDRHRPDDAERIPPDVEWHEVTVIASVSIGAMASGQPGAAIDAVVRRVEYALQDVGAKVEVVRTSTTFHAETALTGFRLRFPESGGGGASPEAERPSNRPLRASLRRHDKKRGTG